MAARALVALLAAALAAGAEGTDAASNPIRKVVNLLQAMQQKVTEEGEREEELYNKFQCYCSSNGGELSASIAASATKVPALGTDIEAAEEQKTGAEADLKQAQIDRSAADQAMAEATALREKEAAEFAKFKAEYDPNIAAIEKAVAALEKGMAGGFLQTGAAQVLRRLVSDTAHNNLAEDDREALASFLSNSEGSSYSPQSGQITGILKELGDEMKASLADATATEKSAVQAHEELMQAKKKEHAALSATIEAKTAKIGELGVSIARMKNDLDDTQQALLADRKYFEELESGCKTKAADWEERKKLRAEELVALAETIKILNDDDALDLFKQTLPSAASASLVEVSSRSSFHRSRAIAALQRARAARPADRASIDLITLALRGKKIGFEQVLAMIDKMVVALKQEQADDDHKMEYCGVQLDKTDDSKKSLERKVADHEAAIAIAKEGIATMTDEIAQLKAGIQALDKSVAQATENRKAEHEEFNQLMASNSAAKEVLHYAKNRLNKFYNAKLHKAPPKRELSSEERISVNMGGEEPATPAPGGIAGMGITVLAQVSEHKLHLVKDAPPPPPETFGAYSKKSEESAGVLAMIDLLVKDLDKEMTEAEVEERDAQADYEVMMQDSAEKRAADAKALTSKEAGKADMEGLLEGHTESKASTGKELMATVSYLQSLHGECDWLMQYYDVRKQARSGEVDALGNAKAVLSGADFSFAQIRSGRRFLQR